MTQNLSHSLILLAGEPKTLQISSIQKEGGSYRIVFKNNPKPYIYNAVKVVWTTQRQWLLTSLYKVYRNGQLQRDVTDIWEFRVDTRAYWRIRYANGYEMEGGEEQLVLTKTCLDDRAARSTFVYLREVAAINPLRREPDSPQSRLSQIYDRTEFVDERAAAACYLNPDGRCVKALSHRDLIFPFGCNASQKKAVAAAFEHQMSVIQGPPGTGNHNN